MQLEQNIKEVVCISCLFEKSKSRGWRGWQPYFYSDPMQLDQNKNSFTLLTLEDCKWMNLSKVRPASFLSPHSSILSFRSSVLGPQSSIFNPQSLLGVTSRERESPKTKFVAFHQVGGQNLSPAIKSQGRANFCHIEIP